MSTTREALLQATKELLAESGYATTSPRAVLSRSGAGQGSLYHHFHGKSDLAATALGEVSAELRAAADELLTSHPDPIEAALAWLTAPRDALRGCRLGRLASEEPVVDEPSLTAPLAEYFRHVTGRLTGLFGAARATGRLPSEFVPGDLAATLVAVVQGGYVLARATGEAEAMTRAQSAAAALLQAATRTTPPPS